MKQIFPIAAAVLFTACQSAIEPDGTVIYPAQAVVTVDKENSVLTAVAVKDGLIVGVGDETTLSQNFQRAEIDRRFEAQTLVPGLIDPHVHMTLGAMMYGLDWVPPWDMPHPNGLIMALPDKTALVEKIANVVADTPGDAPIILYGYHNLVQGDIDRTDLDGISTTLPIVIWHYSGHDFYMNSAALDLLGVTPDLHETYEGVGLDDKGDLNGRIFEDAVLPIFPKLAPYLLSPDHIEAGFNGYETLLRQGGVTTIAEMGYGIFRRGLEDSFLAAHHTEDDAYRLYLVPEHRAFVNEFGEDSADKIVEMAAENPSVLPQVKLFTDAAFYSQTMKMKAPGYLTGQSEGTDGLWVTTPEVLPALMARYWDKGLDIHIHSNGDAAQDSTLSAFAKQNSGKEGQRLIIEHAGLISPDQILTAAELGIGLSAASHYVNYMGEDYRPVIAEKTDYITPLRSALDAGLHVTLHSDAPLAPPLPLLAAGKHMTRATRQGGVSNPAEQLTADQALRAITLDAAWSLGLEDEIGSIEVGKRADFTLLGANPLDVPGESWGAIPVMGVVLDGVIHDTPP